MGSLSTCEESIIRLVLIEFATLKETEAKRKIYFSFSDCRIREREILIEDKESSSQWKIDFDGLLIDPQKGEEIFPRPDEEKPAWKRENHVCRSFKFVSVRNSTRNKSKRIFVFFSVGKISVRSTAENLSKPRKRFASNFLSNL